MKKLNNNQKQNIFLIGVIFIWTAILALIFVFEIKQEKEISRNLVYNEALSKYNSDLDFRSWVSTFGGFYIPVTDNIQPNPYLKMITEQNIQTPSGVELTLMNPAWAIRSLNEYNNNMFFAKSHITSLELLRPENAPDDWETKALESFKSGTTVASEITQIGDEPYFRYMKPLIVERGCLKCHEHQGYKIGDIRGGISVSLLYTPFLKLQEESIKEFGITLGLIYFSGLIFIIISSIIIKKRNYIINQTKDLLIDTNSALENEVSNSKSMNNQLQQKISDHEQAVVALQEANDILYRSSAVVILWKNDPTLTIDFISGNIFNISGYSLEEILNDNDQFIRIIHQEDRDRVFSDFSRMIEINIESPIDPFRILCKDGSEKWIGCRSTFRRNELGEITHIEGIITDISKNIAIEKEKLKLQSQLNHKNKMDGLGQLAGGIAHDFNNILHGISSSAQLLKLRQNEMDTKNLDYIDIILQSSLKASELTNQLLTYSRVDKISFKAVNIHNIVDDSLSILKNAIDKKIIILVEKKADSFITEGDSTGIENAIINLVINSSQSIGDAGEIKIKTDNIYYNQSFCDSSGFDISPGEFCKIEVVDTGIGIPQELLEKVVEPFFTTKKPGEGTGLGLTSVYSTVKNHNGHLEIMSEIGSGTSVVMSFPVTSSFEEKEIEREQVVDGSGKILFVDDEDLNRILVPEMLESLGYEVLTAENGEDALEKYTSNFKEIDVVILDMIMPVMDGRKAFKKLMDFDKNCKIIISSGYTKNESIDEMVKEGLCGFISKPYMLAELNQMLDSILNS